VPSIHETAYPRLKHNPSPRELADIYTPTKDEMALADRVARSSTARLGFLILLKTFQRLGYFVLVREVPVRIVEHIAHDQGFLYVPAGLSDYDESGTRRRHVPLIRERQGAKPFSHEGLQLLGRAVREAARTKEDLADLINVGIEELVHHSFELPGFTTLLEEAQRGRAEVNRAFYARTYDALGPQGRERLERLWSDPGLEAKTKAWNTLKQDPGSPTLTHLKQLLEHHQSLVAQQPAGSALGMMRIHRCAKEALALHRLRHQDCTDNLVRTLREVVIAYQLEGDPLQRLAAIDGVLAGKSTDVLQQCEAHEAHGGNNHFPFLWRFYASHRPTLFRIWRAVRLRSTSHDDSMEKALRFVLEHEPHRAEWLALREDETEALGNLAWVSDAWWKLVTGETKRDRKPGRLQRRYFELCVFTQLLWDLKSGDACIEGSAEFADYREELISWEEFERQAASYGEQVGLATQGAAFVTQTRAWLESIARKTDESFPANEGVRIEQGAPVLSKLPRRAEPTGLQWLEKEIAAKLEPLSILDALTDTEHLLHWTDFFGPLSGHEAKLDRARERYLITTFCYGCNLGPSQTARSLKVADRRQIAWVNQRHITEEKMDQAITALINAYNRFAIPKLWGRGQSASADGTKWDLYEQNLLSEYHIRYGGYGGIGYYHVADCYIALFSHFIPCGVWEAVYILDGLLKNQSELQPDTLHADTQGQNAPVFALAHLLGIQLMPRIRNWKDLTLYRPDPASRYAHIDELFTDTLDWDLIETHLPDMLRIALSIKAGRISAATILRRLGTYSRQNRLYLAFRELGRAIRTGFLLRYLADQELRATIQAATNKSEQFHGFLKWRF